MNKRYWLALDASLYVIILALIAAIYWPISHAGFVWDDTASFHDQGWLHGDAWKQSVWRGFNGWVNYFRPLVLLLFTAQVHAFDATPGPMHVVSLCIHLLDTLLVGLLAYRLSETWPDSHRILRSGLPMLFYGLHPALIEAVDWIGCQFELALTFFMLLGLLLNASLKKTSLRAIGAGLCFFFAACCKESALAFPLFVVIFDLYAERGRGGWLDILRATWRRQRVVYAAVLLGGLAYLAVRYWALGYFLVPTAAPPLFAFARLQQASLTYLSYWKLIIWPMGSIGPIHAVDGEQFTAITAGSLATDAAALSLALGCGYAFWKRHTTGFLLLAGSAALLPVLNLVPVGFNEGLYHDRYAMAAIAVVCALLPGLLIPLYLRAPLIKRIVPIVAVVWLAFAVANVRVTTPLWADGVALWQWARQQEPKAITPKSQLLTAYIARNDHEHARELGDELLQQGQACPTCLLNIAYLALSEHDATRAALALGKLKDARVLAYDKGTLHNYIFANGMLLELQGDPTAAEEAYRDAITVDELDPVPKITLAALLATHGRMAEARPLAEAALSLFAPDERVRRRQEFESAAAAARNP
jgi:hypothetical protein